MLLQIQRGDARRRSAPRLRIAVAGEARGIARVPGAGDADPEARRSSGADRIRCSAVLSSAVVDATVIASPSTLRRERGEIGRAPPADNTRRRSRRGSYRRIASSRSVSAVCHPRRADVHHRRLTPCAVIQSTARSGRRAVGPRRAAAWENAQRMDPAAGATPSVFPARMLATWVPCPCDGGGSQSSASRLPGLPLTKIADPLDPVVELVYACGARRCRSRRRARRGQIAVAREPAVERQLALVDTVQAPRDSAGGV